MADGAVEAVVDGGKGSAGEAKPVAPRQPRARAGQGSPPAQRSLFDP
jgi:hypothetical protein